MKFGKVKIASFCSVLIVVITMIAVLSGVTLRRTKVAFTFDDGTVDHYTVAAPILEKYGYRGLFSVCTDMVGSKGFMTWTQIKDLHSRGHTIASHTKSHANVGSLYEAGDIEGVKYQIEESKKAIEKNAGVRAEYLCFPHGNHNSKVFELVRAYGLEPIVVRRLDLGGGMGYSNPMLNVGEYLNCIGRSFLQDQCVMMFHVVNDGRGYAAYGDNGEKFEAVVRNVWLHDGEWYDVVNYRDNTWQVEDTSTFCFRLKSKLQRLVLKLNKRSWK